MPSPADHTVFTLNDLASWSRSGASFAVLGQPIRHSVSPAMHNAVLTSADSRLAAWSHSRYFRFEVAPEDLATALPRLHAAGFYGLNLTVPHKVLACGLVARIDPAARAIGAVNTLRRIDQGWEGFNTDGYGLAAGLQTDLGRALAGADVLLLGAGGAARGAAVQCLAAGVASLWIANRTAANLARLLEDLRPLVPAGSTLRGFGPEAALADLPAGLIVINATSAGLKANDPLPFDLKVLPCPAAAYDMIYNPPRTSWLASAQALGLPCANGLSMLVHQGAKALEIWTGYPAPEAAPLMDRAARTALGL